MLAQTPSKRWQKRCACTAFILSYSALVGVGEARAQSLPEAPSAENARVTKLTLALGASYDTNIARVSEALARSRGLEPEDTKISSSVNVDLARELAGQVIFVQGEAGYEFYRTNDRLNRERVDLTAGISRAFASCQPMAFASYRVFQSQVSDLDLSMIENLQRVTATGASVACGTESGLGGLIGVQRAITRNSTEAQQLSNNETVSGMGMVTYTTDSLGTVSLTLADSSTEYNNRLASLGPTSLSFGTRSAGLGVEREAGSRLKVVGSASATEIKQRGGGGVGQTTRRSTTYNAEVEYAGGKRYTVRLGALREVRPSQTIGRLYDLATSLNAEAEYRMSPRLMVALGHRREDSEAVGQAILLRPVVQQARLDQSFLELRLGSSGRGSLVLDVRRESRRTNLDPFNYTATRLGLRAELRR